MNMELQNKRRPLWFYILTVLAWAALCFECVSVWALFAMANGGNHFVARNATWPLNGAYLGTLPTLLAIIWLIFSCNDQLNAVAKKHPFVLSRRFSLLMLVLGAAAMITLINIFVF